MKCNQAMEFKQEPYLDTVAIEMHWSSGHST